MAKRLGYLYDNIYKIENIKKAFDEVCKNKKIRQRLIDLKNTDV